MIDFCTLINGIEVQARYSDRTVKEVFIPLLETLTRLQREKGRRILVMLAAPPGAGKSTLVSFLEHLVVSARDGEYSGQHIQAIGMDGFHRRQEYLLSHCVERDGRQIPMVKIKGAPVTFDLPKLEAGIARVAKGDICGWPVYDRMRHNPVEDAITVSGDIVLLEGNYLLLDEDGWRGLKNYADYTISVSADAGMLQSRLIDRRIKTGVDLKEATRFVDFSDMPNVMLCLEKTMPADLSLYTDGNEYFRMEEPDRRGY